MADRLTNSDDNDSIAFGAAEIAAMQPRLYGFILKRLADREQTAEVLQRTNVVLCQKIDEFEPGTNFAAWAFTIARFQLMAWRTSQARNRLVFSDAAIAALEDSADAEAAGVDQRVGLLRDCLQRLKADDLVLIQSRYRDGEAVADVAERLKKSSDAIAMRLMRVRRRLRDCVERGMAAEGL